MKKIHIKQIAKWRYPIIVDVHKVSYEVQSEIKSETASFISYGTTYPIRIMIQRSLLQGTENGE